MTDAVDLFIEEARGVSVTDAAQLIGIAITSKNHAGPCPACGGRDRFSISPARQAWNCRGCGHGGRDGIGLMALANGHDVSSLRGFLAACADALGRPVPAEGERESDDERAVRLARIAEQKRRNEERAKAQADSQNDFRLREINKARGIFQHAGTADDSDVARYLRLRTGFDMAPEVFANLRFNARHTYWHGQDDRGHPLDIYSGPAMIAPFVNLDGRIIGCHQTWIDLGNAPKYRPDLGIDDKGEALPAKKMRGTKKGGLIPLFGLMTSARWVGGEGIENGLAIAGAEGFRRDTFYFAAGDLGNLAGPADPKSAFSHPSLKKEDKRGRLISVRVQGPEPRADQTADDAMQIGDHVTQLVLLADGDSELVATAAAMARAEKRMGMEGRSISTWWPPEHMDFSKLMAGC